MGSPWLKFYPTDWQADTALRFCSIAARGLWVEMLCVMHNSEQYGHLLINGQMPNDHAIAIICGVPYDQLPALLGELEKAGVFSRNSNGVIYSRRLVKDHKKSNVARKNVKKRWKSEKLDQPQVIVPIDENLSGNTNRTTNRITNKKPEARINNNYKFGGHVIRLNDQDYERWREIHGGPDPAFWAYLESRDDWLNNQPQQVQRSWFVSTQNHLKQIGS